MHYVKKLKTDTNLIGVVPAIFSLVAAGIAGALFGAYTAIKLLGGIILVYSTFQFVAAYRTKNIGYTISAIYMLFLGMYMISLRLGDFGRSKILLSAESKIIGIFTILFLLIIIYLLLTRQIKWRGRDVLELAAMNVEPSDNSYTDRPSPIAKLDYTKSELINFTEFLKRKLVALPFFEQERIVLVLIKMGNEFRFIYGGSSNYWDNTWIAFDYSGEVSAHISKADYLDYKENLAFGKLCEELGNEFIDFFELYEKGEQSRIIDKLNDMKIGFFS